MGHTNRCLYDSDINVFLDKDKYTRKKIYT